MQLQYLCALLTVVIILPANSTIINVDGNHGVSNTTCCPSNNLESPSLPCKTLNLALECVYSLPLTTPVSVFVSEGVYALNYDSNLTLIEGRLGGYAITGNCSFVAPCVEINCERNAGLSFIRSDGIKLENLAFSGCGFPNNSTSKDFSMVKEPHFLQVKSTLYFLLCRTVTLSHITVNETEGTGVVMYSTVGINTITHSQFVSSSPNSKVSGSFTGGGGGLYIEFAYCYPGNTSCFNGPSNIPEDFTRDSTYIISDSIFAENLANVTDTSFILPQKSKHLAFGRGGGLSLFFKGSATNNSVNIETCGLYNNTALWGGGLFIEVEDFSSNNVVSVNNTILTGNQCLFKESNSHGTGGGGARISFVFFEDTHAKRNSIVFANCSFLRNYAYYGGGTSFYAAREPSESSPTNTLIFMNTMWEGNVARAGSGVDLSVLHTIPKGAVVNFTHCCFQKTMDFIRKNRAQLLE